MRRTISLLVVVLAVAAINCSPYSPDLGATPYLCADVEPKCPDDYACMDDGSGRMVCVSSGGNVPDSNNGFQCSSSDGPPIEPNDTKEMAFQTDVSPTQSRIYGPLAICPETDRDHFQVNVAVANKGIEAITTWTDGMPVSVSILNASGSSIANGVAMGTGANRACVTNLNVAQFYVAVFAAAKNNYKVELKMVDACTQ